MLKNLFCIPHAGGSAYVFSEWKKYIDTSIQLHPVELAGRGRFIKEPLYKTFNEAVDDVFAKIKDKLHDSPYVLFGHSMGSTLVYELVYRIMANEAPLPEHVILSGRLPPEYNDLYEKMHDASLDVFQEEIIRLGGTSREIFDNRELCELFLPVLRADYKILEQYQLPSGRTRLPVSISVFFGAEDNPDHHDKTEDWSNHTEIGCQFYRFSGGHFFIRDRARDVVKTINSIMLCGSTNHL